MQTSDYLNQLVQDKSDLVDNLTTMGIEDLTGEETFTELVPKVLDISGGGTTEPEEKDVNFYDYDGTRLYSYTKDEFLAMNEFPENPTHDGLTSQGWNWELTNAKASVNRIGVIDIGQNYITDDNTFRVYIEVSDNYKFSLSISPLQYNSGHDFENDYEIDWGDGTSRTTYATKTHTYTTGGNYVIKVYKKTPTDISTDGDKLVFSSGASRKNAINFLSIKKIENADFMSINANNYTYLYNLETITFPVSLAMGSNGNPRFGYNYKLKCIICPKNNSVINGQGECPSCYNLKKIVFSHNTSTQLYGFDYCYNLQRLIVYQSHTLQNVNGITDFYTDYITGTDFFTCGNTFIKKINISEGITRFNASNSLANNYQLEYIVMPSTLTSIYNNLFNNCYVLKYIDFSKCNQIPTIQSSTFPSVSNLPSQYNFKYFIVPDDLYEDWVVATNWSNYTDYIIKKSDWEAL